MTQAPCPRLAILGIVLASAILPCGMARAAAPGTKPHDLTDIPIEQLLEMQVVVGASLHEQKASEAPSSVSVISAEEIRRFGYRTLAEILGSVRGVFVSSDRNYTYLGVRGVNRPGDYISRVLLLIDGHRLNENVYGGVGIGTDQFLDIDLIERVEVIRGPSSSLYGTGAFFGVINIVTRKGGDVGGTTTSIAAGAYRTLEGTVTFGRQTESGANLLVSASGFQSPGHALYYPEYDDPATNDGVAEDADADTASRLFASWSNGGLKVQIGRSRREKEIPTGAYGVVFGDPTSRTVDEREYLDLSYRRAFAGDGDFTGRIYYDRSYYSGRYLFDYPPVTTFADLSRGSWTGIEARLAIPAGDKHRLTTGVDLKENIAREQASWDVDPFALYVDTNDDSGEWGLFVQDEIEVHARMRVNLGLRHDRYDTFGGSTNPRVAVLFNPAEATTLKFLYGEAFRAPNAYELFYDGGGQKSNPGLQPETIRNWEIVAERELAAHARLAWTFYGNDFENLIYNTTDPNGLIVYLNSRDPLHSRGTEAEFEMGWEDGSRLRFSAAYQVSRIEGNSLQTSNSPRLIAHLNYWTPIAGPRLGVGIEFQQMSARRLLGGGLTDGGLLANINLVSRELAPGLEISAGVYNLFDRAYGDPGSTEHLQEVIPQDGRTYRLKATWKF